MTLLQIGFQVSHTHRGEEHRAITQVLPQFSSMARAQDNKETEQHAPKLLWKNRLLDDLACVSAGGRQQLIEVCLAYCPRSVHGSCRGLTREALFHFHPVNLGWGKGPVLQVA